MSKQKILFTTVVGPYGQDTHRTRFKNPMSLLSNQVTRGQKYFTVRMYQRAFAFDLFAVNLSADVAVLNFPSIGQLRAVLKSQNWTRIGLSAIIPNFESLLETYKVVREILPNVDIDIGGHICNDEKTVQLLVERMRIIHPQDRFRISRPIFEEQRVKEDSRSVSAWLSSEGIEGERVTFVKRDGLEYYARLKGVGLRSESRLYAPLVPASTGKRVLGLPLSAATSGLLIPDVGCPMRCNFCATSHKFNGKFVQFLRSEEDIMAVANAHADQGRDEMFVMSENFSLDTARALRLLRLMETQQRPHKFCVFSSANGLIRLGVENIVKLGYSFIWIGLEESSGTTFKKTHGINLIDLVSDLQRHGVEVLGSTILGFEHQKLEDLDREVEHALRYRCVYNQFMLYMPAPGTPFWDRMRDEGFLKKDYKWEDLHGQATQNWHHPHLDERTLEARLDRAFEQDFEILGPSLYRMMKVHYNGYVTTQEWEHALVQMRRKAMRAMFEKYVPLLSAMYRDLKPTGHRALEGIGELREQLLSEIGKSGRRFDRIAYPLVYGALQIEKFRYKRWQRLRRVPGPRCTLTYYGNFRRKRRIGMIKMESALPSILVRSPHRYAVEQTCEPEQSPWL